ncbi:MAG: sensor histidine kinase [Spirochaetales bacterium]|nr:sensor histidine kinase [Spirochaetales bacterium]
MNNKIQHRISDSLSVISIIAITFIISGQLEFFEKFSKFSEQYEQYQLDEILIVCVVLTYYLLFIFLKQKQVLKKKNIKATETLVEKTLLLKEIHHRHKNNINTILSLLKLDENSFATAESKGIYYKMVSRLESMSVLYENIHNSENKDYISVKDYFTIFFNREDSLFNNKITTSMDIEDFQISTRLLTPLGIIINELYTNSAKHAFPDQKSCRIFFSAKKTKDMISINFSDNGIGMPETVRPGGFGHELIHSLTKQINAEIEIKNDHGTSYNLIFNAEGE